MRILIKFASRSRPAKFFAALDNIVTNATHHDYIIVVSADYDDLSMFNPEVRDNADKYKNLYMHYGESKSKVDAINRDLEFYTDWDILINMSDDMEFIRHGFDSIIVAEFKRRADTDVFLHYPDQAAGSALCTMSIMGRQYFNRFNYIYHPDYKSLWCDNEAQEVSKILRRYVFVKTRLFNHNHPAWGLAPTDALMIHTESFHDEDKATFERRKLKNFYLV